MITIIRQGNTTFYYGDCKTCGCLFICNESDMNIHQGCDCPHCGREVKVVEVGLTKLPEQTK